MNNKAIFIDICEFCNQEFKYPAISNGAPKMDGKNCCYMCLIFKDNPNGIKMVTK
jgi:hypothetical protein